MRLIILHSSHPLLSCSSLTHTLLLNYITSLLLFLHHLLCLFSRHLSSPFFPLPLSTLLFLSLFRCEKIIGHGISCFINRQLIYNFPEQVSGALPHLSCTFFAYPSCAVLSLAYFHLLFLPFLYCFTFPAPTFCPLSFPSSPIDTHLSLLPFSHVLLSPSLPYFRYSQRQELFLLNTLTSMA